MNVVQNKPNCNNSYREAANNHNQIELVESKQNPNSRKDT
jgi:hypothetical protein